MRVPYLVKKGPDPDSPTLIVGGISFPVHYGSSVLKNSTRGPRYEKILFAVPVL